jgi:LmbE family N-acetylglucosaminyl deacetylase
MKIFNSRKTKIHRLVFLAALAIASIITSPRAQQPAAATQPSSEDRVALYQALLDLTNPWTVMCIAAHPDDEDGTSLIVMRHKFGAHTVSLFSTFGEGGQNAIGPELYEELGAIRARETMAAAEIQGSEPHFLGLKDFGYSKTADEAFRFWGHDEGLRRMVLEIRKLRPDVIITNHSVTSNDHGQHQASARMVVEAFDAAADPNKFPEQLKDGVTTWQVQRLFVRARRVPEQLKEAATAGQNPDRQGGGEQFVTIDPNEHDPIRGVVYAEEALRALQKHATQGPWPKTFAEYATRFRAFSGQQGGTPGQLPMIRYVLVRDAKGSAPLSAKDSHSFLDGLRLPENVAKDLAPPTIEGQPLITSIDDRDKLASALISANKTSAYGRPRTVTASDRLSADPRLFSMNKKLNVALAIALGISAQLTPSDLVLIPGGTTKFQFRINNRGTRAAIAKQFWFGEKHGKSEPGTLMGPELPPNLLAGKTLDIPLSYDTSASAGVSVPHSEHLYDGRVNGLQLEAAMIIDLGETDFTLLAERVIDVAPPVEVKAPQVFVSTAQSTSRQFSVELTNNEHGTFSGRVVLKVVPTCESIACKEAAFEESVQLRGLISKSLTLAPADTTKVQMSIPFATLASRQHGSSSTDRSYKLTFQIVGRSSEIAGESTPVVVSYSNAQVARGLRVGYIRGFDFSLPNALSALGVDSKELSVEDAKTADLSTFTSVIVDNRVFESKPELIAVNQKLLDYANAGGTLIVFYHKSDEWNPDARRNRPQLAPYKLILGNERITDENAPVTFIEPQHRLLNIPNKMGQEDFTGWIQERGLYYPKEWDPQFHALLQSNDPGEAPLKGGLLVADYGRGHYIYTSMVWYRQLRAGVPGAYRMFANMISYGH